MSQVPYPTPPSAPYGYMPLPPDLAKPSRRAGMLMILLGVFILLLGGCIGLASGVMSIDRLPPEMLAQARQIEAQSHLSWDLFLKIFAAIVAVPGLILIVLGLFVRRGGFVAPILGVILTAIILFNLASFILQALYQATLGNASGAVPAVFFFGALIGLFGLQIFWLAKAVINAGPLKVFNQQHQAYAWQMYQQQQQYTQQQYPYPPPPPPPGS